MADPFRPVTGPYTNSMVLAELARLWNQARRAKVNRAARVSQKSLAKASCVPAQTISTWSNGKSLPRDLNQLIAVGEILANWAGERPLTGNEWSTLLDVDRNAHRTIGTKQRPGAGDGPPTDGGRAGPGSVVVPVPAQLPLDVGSYVGRDRELGRLAELMADAGAVVVTAIDGTAGVGKTALAVHASHQWRDRFPDGQLYVDLGGHSPTRDPADPAQVLEEFLRSLGYRPDGIPPQTQDRARLYRSTLADRRLLVVLDNAASEAQVRPLLPGTGSSMVIVTSRHSLAGLEIGGDARITLDTLGADEAVDMLAAIAGSERISDEQNAAAQVADLCDRLPLALSIAGHVLTVHPAWTVARLADRLGDERRRLDELELGDRGVRAAFTVSYTQLESFQARVFRLLGLHPGRDLTVPAAAALTSLDEHSAARILDTLAQAHLIHEGVPDRFAMHDLLHLFAYERAHHDEDAPSREVALRGMFIHYRDVARDIGRRWHSARASATPRDAVQVIALLEKEHANITAVALLAASKEEGALWRIAESVAAPLFDGRFFSDVLPLFHAVRDTARTAGARPLEFRALIILGNTYRETWQSVQAIAHLEQALAIARTDKFKEAEHVARNDLALAYRAHGESDKAIECLKIAAKLSAETGDRDGEARALGNLAATYTTMGRPDLAPDALKRSMRHFENLDHGRHDQALVLLNYARNYMIQGDFNNAMLSCDSALAICHEFGDRHLEGHALRIKGDIYKMQDRDDDAAAYLHQAIEILNETDPHYARLVELTIPPAPREQ